VRAGLAWNLVLRLAQAAALALLPAACALAAAGPAKAKEAVTASYTIPNIVAIVMCFVVLAIACKHFRRV
jgi:hypothetical protein